MNKPESVITNQIEPGMDIVLTKWIGLEGTVKIMEAKEQELSQKLPRHLLETARGFSSYLSIQKEQDFAAAHKVPMVFPVAEGGIFSALWNMAEPFRVGLEIQLRMIPVRQETIEICEQFRLNPYLLCSNGAVLMADWRGHDLVDCLKKEGIASTVIGKAVKGNDRILYNEEEQRFLDRPQKDELYKILEPQEV